MTNHRNVRFLSATLAVLSLARPAHAEDIVAPDSTFRQMGTCDIVGKVPLVAALGIVGVRGLFDAYSEPLLRTRTEERLFLAAAGTASFAHVVCGPAIHGAKGNFTKALASLGLRAGLPAVAFAMTYGVYKATERPGDHVYGTPVSGVFGTIAMSAAVLSGFALDYIVLARPASPVATWRPSLFPTQSGISVGIGGSL